MFRLLTTVLFAIAMLAYPAVAQDIDQAAEGEDSFVPIPFHGIAVAQAPEAGLGICIGAEAQPTIQCAQDACMTQSGLTLLDCTANLWCYPHGWVADIFMQHSEGPHWHSFICAQDSRETLDKLIAVSCDEEYLIECSAVRIWDPDGSEVLGQVQEQITVLE